MWHCPARAYSAVVGEAEAAPQGTIRLHIDPLTRRVATIFLALVCRRRTVPQKPVQDGSSRYVSSNGGALASVVGGAQNSVSRPKCGCAWCTSRVFRDLVPRYTKKRSECTWLGLFVLYPKVQPLVVSMFFATSVRQMHLIWARMRRNANHVYHVRLN
ncbi:hypothetical protein TGME49_283800 [Toxoplasma gondii ME49]|uniref:Uncharacterized protein n=4 Tax=Toxoplasma gondii TaxID=5811 RepID=S8F551_TOXGM|nr:hypothetical protein TGME49_283800 [Toxoplasma gondii ME49]EPT30936.1 hypothetical protein TGME49_283800 [Toxoplasma gondii ME49]KFH04995.1 putative transmembrane protein [Toxoplasma gondii MAS]KYF38997.1 hypothetical protein TGARI_283800 [Toxoplasma gondii ARI]PIM00364.1 putative transmembrane protein [Toxoplasma gondii COUG]|eukprot:XP_018637743.1 hypothetical protein TGME49_283800 [Toxoplasma gondii ME49]